MKRTLINTLAAVAVIGGLAAAVTAPWWVVLFICLPAQMTSRTMANERYFAAVTGILQQCNSLHITDVEEKDGALIVNTDIYAIPGYLIEQLIKAGREENKATPVITIVSVEKPRIQLIFPL